MKTWKMLTQNSSIYKTKEIELSEKRNQEIATSLHTSVIGKDFKANF